MARSENGDCSVSQAAARLGVSRVSVWRWIRDGHLPATRVGPRLTRIRCADVDRARVQIQTGHARPWIARTPAAADADIDAAAPLSPLPVAARAHDHAVQFYETDAFLLETVAEYIGAGLRAGEACIVFASKRRRDDLGWRPRASGVDLEDAEAHGRYTSLDAAETLSRFMTGVTPDAARFRAAVGGIVATAGRDGRPVRIFGEMVSLLATAGNIDAALHLEALWTELQRDARFSLLCAYPIGSPGAERLAGALGDICAAHSRVIPAESFTRLASAEDRLQAIVTLQQKTFWLQAQIEERQRSEDGLRLALAAEQDALQEAIATQRQRDEVISRAVQEMKHPLASLSLQAQHALITLGRERPLEPGLVERAVQAVAGQPARVPRLIAQVIDFSHLEARKLALQPRWADLARLVTTSVAEARARGHRQEIIVSAPPSVALWIDPERAAHVVASLLENAIRHSPRDGAIAVAIVALEHGVVELSVQDRGERPPEARRERVFEQDEGDAPEADPGPRLGLVVSRQIVELHGGELFTEFPPDGGCRVVMRLPRGLEEPVTRVAAD